MDEKRLQEILDRANAATPGPWEPAWNWDKRDGPGYVAWAEGPINEGATLNQVAALADRDKDFIAHARQDIPDLIAALRDAQEQLKQIELVTSVTESVRSQTVALLEKQRDEARSVVVEADAQFNIDKIPGSYDFAKVSIVCMAANGRAAMDECEELKHKLEASDQDARDLATAIVMRDEKLIDEAVYRHNKRFQRVEES